MKSKDARSLPSESQEDLRIKAVNGVRDGMTQVEAAKTFGVSRQAIRNWLDRYQAGGVFFARLLPVIRHLISIPAGIVRMSFGLFSFVTLAGSALWCWILAYLGDKAYRVEPELLTSPEALVRFIHGQSSGILLIVTLFAALYMLTLRLMKPRSGP